MDDQFYRCIDVRNPSKPVEVGRWWMPGTRAGDNVAPPPRHTLDKGYRAHNTNVYPQRPDRLYLGYIDGGMFVLDIADKSKPTPICHWTNSPPYTGFMHTVMPLLSRNLLVVTDESTENAGKDWPKLIWILDNRDEAHPISIATCPMPPLDEFSHRGGRFGAHNIHENVPLPTAWRSEEIILGTFFNGGLRAFDITNAYAPHEIGVLRAAGAEGLAGRRGAAQRRVRRRARHRLHRRSLHRRLVYSGDGFLDEAVTPAPERAIRCRARPR